MKWIIMRFLSLLFVIILSALCQSACSTNVSVETTSLPPVTRTNTPDGTVVPTATPVPSATQTNTPQPSLTPTQTSSPTVTPVPTETPTPTSTIDPTQQAWYARAVEMRDIERAASWKAREEKEAKIAQFPKACDDTNDFDSDISPDGKWYAASCGYYRDQKLIVQNLEGIKWVLDFKDFLSPETEYGISGSIYPLFWSQDGEFLYFTKRIGYSGGGNQCFSWGDGYGLFRLKLMNGSWSTLVSPNDLMPGDKIRFSPTGEKYAIDINGITIMDLETGKVNKIKSSGIYDLSWSPDGEYLAYSEASCGDEFVESSSVFLWNASKNKAILLMTEDGILLRPDSWIDDSTLRIIGERWVGGDSVYSIYEYNIPGKSILLIGTATPSP